MELVALLIAALASLAALRQIEISTRQAKLQATFEYIREIRGILQQGRVIYAPDARQQALDFYNRKAEPTEQAKQYLQFTDACDLLALAYEKNIVDREVVDEYFAGLLKAPTTFNIAFIVELRKCLGDATVYEHLERMLKRIPDHTTGS